MLTYEDAKQWGGQILEVTQSRYMPPWLPAPDVAFQGDRRLSDAELASLRRWVGAGMLPGSGSKERTISSLKSVKTEGGDWKLAPPDAVISVTPAVALTPSGDDTFISLEAQYPGDQTQTLSAVEIRVSDPQAVRSIWVQVDPKGAFRAAHPEIGDGGLRGVGLSRKDEALLSKRNGLMLWTPEAPVLHVGGNGLVLQPKSGLVLTGHFKTTGKAEPVQLTVGLHYRVGAKGAAAVQPVSIELGTSEKLEIPAGEANYVSAQQFTLPRAATVTAIYPRAHFLCRQLETFAVLPSGRRQTLITIPKWDIDWTGVYRYKKPTLLPKGTVVHWRYVYDNTASNPHNPSDPPAAVGGGEAAREESNQLWLELLPASPGHEPADWSDALQSAAAAQ